MSENRGWFRCGHGLRAVVRSVKKTNDNYGRRFYGCPCGKEDDCGFFEWLDQEEYGPRARHVILGLLSAKAELDNELVRAKGKLEEVLGVADEAQSQIAEMKMEVKRLNLENKKLKQQVKTLRARCRANVISKQKERTCMAVVVLCTVFLVMYCKM